MIVTSFFARLGFQIDAGSLIRVRRVLASLKRDIQQLSGGQTRIGINNQQALQRIRQVQQELGRLRSQTIRMTGATRQAHTTGATFTRTMGTMRRSAGGLGDQIQRLTGDIRRVWAWWVTFNAVAGLAGTLFRTILETESLRQRLETVAGSAQAGAEAFQFIVDVARDTPGSIDDVTTAFIRLGQLGIPQTRELFEEVGNFGAAFATNVGDMVKAASDLAVGVARPFELITGVNADMRADATKIIFMWRGQRVEIERNTAAILEWMRSVGRTEFAGATERWMASILGAMEKMGDSFTAFKRRMADAGLRDALSRLFTTISGILGGQGELAERMGRAMARAVDTLTRGLVWLNRNLDQVVRHARFLGALIGSRIVMDFALALTRVFVSLLNPVNALIAALMFLPLIFEDLYVFVSGTGHSLIGSLIPPEDRERVRASLTMIGDTLLTTLQQIGEALWKIAVAFTDMLSTLFGEDVDLAGFIGGVAAALGAVAVRLGEIISTLLAIPGWLIEWIAGDAEEQRFDRLEASAEREVNRQPGMTGIGAALSGSRDAAINQAIVGGMSTEERAAAFGNMLGQGGEYTRAQIDRMANLVFNQTVNIQGSTNMGAGDVSRATAAGGRQAVNPLGAALRSTAQP